MPTKFNEKFNEKFSRKQLHEHSRKGLVPFVSSVLALCLIVMCSAGCVTEAKAVDLLSGIEKRETKPVSDLSYGSAKVTDFAVKLFKACEEKGKNVLISPLSVMTALAMTANGAAGDTLKEFEDTFGMKREDLNAFLHAYTEKLPSGQKYKLHLANSLWFANTGFKADDDFLHTVADYYDADIYAVPFDEGTKKDINNWVKRETDGVIPEILDSIPPEAVMYLVNALAFDAEWRNIYRDKDIRKGEFTRENGEIRTVEFMCGNENIYLEDKNAKGFVKLYADKKYAFAVLLPDEGISVSDYVSSLDGEKIKDILTGRKDMALKAAIPKFETEYSTEMSDILKKAGIDAAFDPEKADLSSLGKSGAGNLFINRVIHKTYISVDERGTKAGAATAVEINKYTAQNPVSIILNRPFVYMIVDCENNVPFFIGTMMNPEK